MSIIDRVKSLAFPLGHYVVVGSGTLEVLGIRKAADIDIAVTFSLLDRVRAEGGWSERREFSNAVLRKAEFELLTVLHWKDFPHSTQEVIDAALVIEGVPFMNLDHLRKYKRALGRAKDLQDLVLLDQYGK